MVKTVDVEESPPPEAVPTRLADALGDALFDYDSDDQRKACLTHLENILEAAGLGWRKGDGRSGHEGSIVPMPQDLMVEIRASQIHLDDRLWLMDKGRSIHAAGDAIDHLEPLLAVWRRIRPAILR